MNLESDKRLIQLRLDFSSAPTGEARQARREAPPYPDRWHISDMARCPA
jgi:hypothetical protein